VNEINRDVAVIRLNPGVSGRSERDRVNQVQSESGDRRRSGIRRDRVDQSVTGRSVVQA
jgi:hypothetical protein